MNHKHLGGAMIYTIGYQRITQGQLLHAAQTFGATVVDVRSVPSSRKPGFSRRALEAALGPRYEWHGDKLGGRPGPTADGLAWLARQTRSVLLLCLEEAPGDCHRHHAIGAPLAQRGVEVRHICKDQVFTAAELALALDTDMARHDS
jgi:uncharacterized protein (DUF488 family)